MTSEGLSVRAGGRDENVYRCSCGAWAYTGIACSTCATSRGEKNERSTTD